MSDTALVLLTDALWTLACTFGSYYGLGLVRHSSAAYRYSAGTFPRRRSREQFRLSRVAAALLLAAVALGSLLGVIVIGGDLLTWVGNEPLETDARRMLYRAILISVMALITLALRKMWQVYELWGQE